MRTIRTLIEQKGGVVHAIEPEAPVLAAIQKMADAHIGAVLVMEGQQLKGIISERDYARKVILLGRSSAETPVWEVMTGDLVTVTPDRSVHGCMKLMTEHRIRHLPVVQNDTMVGFVSIGDLVKYRMDRIEADAAAMREYIAQ